MAEDLDDATLSLVAHNLRGAIGLAAGATRTVRLRWDRLDDERRNELLELAERGMARVDDAVFGIARGLPAEVIADLQQTFDREEGTGAAAAEAADLLEPKPYPVPDDEEERLAAHLTGAPNAVINLIDADRQWQAAAHGVERGEVRREQSMCAAAVVHGQTVSVADSSADERYRDSPFVTGELGNIRLYAAAPLVAPVRHVVGTICVFADEVRALDDAQVAALEDLARVVTSLFEERALAAELKEAARWQHVLIADLEREPRRYEHLLDRLARHEA
jgi:GAF domain-containing protein